MKDKFPVGISVIATPKDGDFAHEFTGTVISHNKGFIQVIDGEENVYDCEPDQLTLEEPEVKDSKGVVASVLDAIFGTGKKQGCCGGKCGCKH